MGYLRDVGALGASGPFMPKAPRSGGGSISGNDIFISITQIYLLRMS